MRADVLSQRIFTAGCFGLPWLWVVHVLYERGLDEAGNSENSEDPTNQGLLDADEHFPDAPTTMSPQQIVEARKAWVSKCQVGAIAVFGTWFAWIVLAQIFKYDLPGSLFIRSADDGAFTGW